jgi:hypothetical protein
LTATSVYVLSKEMELDITPGRTQSAPASSKSSVCSAHDAHARSDLIVFKSAFGKFIKDPTYIPCYKTSSLVLRKILNISRLPLHSFYSAKADRYSARAWCRGPDRSACKRQRMHRCVHSGLAGQGRLECLGRCTFTRYPSVQRIHRFSQTGSKDQVVNRGDCWEAESHTLDVVRCYTTHICVTSHAGHCQILSRS